MFQKNSLTTHKSSSIIGGQDVEFGKKRELTRLNVSVVAMRQQNPLVLSHRGGFVIPKLFNYVQLTTQKAKNPLGKVDKITAKEIVYTGIIAQIQGAVKSFFENARLVTFTSQITLAFE